MKKFLILILVSATLFSCDNWRARNLGGTETVELKPGQRLVNIAWKDADLWILTKTDTTKPTTYTLKEKSSVGVMSGTVIIKEQ